MANTKSNYDKNKPKEQMNMLVLPTAESPAHEIFFSGGGRQEQSEELVEGSPGRYHLPKDDIERRREIGGGRIRQTVEAIAKAATAGASDWELQEMISEAWSKGLISDELEALLSEKYGRAYKNYMRKGNLNGKWDWEQWPKQL